MEEKYIDLNNISRKKIKKIIEKDNEKYGATKNIYKALIFVFIETFFAIIITIKVNFYEYLSSEKVRKINIIALINCFAYVLIFLVISTFIKFNYHGINKSSIAVCLLFAVFQLFSNKLYNTNAPKFMILMGIWALLIYIIIYLIVNRKKLFEFSMSYILGLLGGLTAVILQFLLTYIDLRTDNKYYFRMIFTDSPKIEIIFSVISGLLLSLIIFIVENYTVKTEKILDCLPYFSGIGFIFNLVYAIITKEFSNLGRISQDSELSKDIFFMVIIIILFGIEISISPFFIMKCGGYSVILCLCLIGFFEYAYSLFANSLNHDQLMKLFILHIFTAILHLAAIFASCYSEINSQQNNKIMNQINELIKDRNEIFDSAPELFNDTQDKNDYKNNKLLN